MALWGFIRAVIILKVSSTLRAPHETFMAWAVIVQKSMSSSFKRKSERLLLLLMGLSVFHLTVTVQCVLKGERGKLNSHCEQIEVGGSPTTSLQICLLNMSTYFETLSICFSYKISDFKVYLSRRRVCVST